jgi:hypothetical protein
MKFAVEPDDGTLFLTWDGARFSVQTMTDHVRGYVKRSEARCLRALWEMRSLVPMPGHMVRCYRPPPMARRLLNRLSAAANGEQHSRQRRCPQ